MINPFIGECLYSFTPSFTRNHNIIMAKNGHGIHLHTGYHNGQLHFFVANIGMFNAGMTSTVAVCHYCCCIKKGP